MRFSPIRALFAATCVLLPTLVLSNTAAAQLPIPQFSILGGVTHSSGTNSSPIGELRLNIPLIVLSAEGSFGVAHVSQSGVSQTFIIPEAQLQYPFLPFLVKPYVGIGGGWIKAVSGPGDHDNAGTFSVSAGVRVAPPLIGIGLRGEIRYRAVGSSIGNNMTDFTVGISF
jgi:hypothetical protein